MGPRVTHLAQCLEWSLHPVDIGSSFSTVFFQLCLPMEAERAKLAWGRGWRDEHPLTPRGMTKDIFLSLLSPGSVVVEHDIILQAKFSPEYKEEFKKFTQEIEKKITNVTQQQIMRNNTCTSKFLGFWGGA